ncbi:hypothetical protein V1517DRAFT_307897 [Lipomyces orientalis]|uniref:Uncharacterized protein n=1 Tax=Lipomyces orientalis TaxID=1233043 RepID=A0ACC3TN11_9ASCO
MAETLISPQDGSTTPETELTVTLARSKAHRKLVGILAIVLSVAIVAVVLGVGLGVGLNKGTEPPAMASSRTSTCSTIYLEPTSTYSFHPPSSTSLNTTGSYCISESNVVKSPRFDNLSDWKIANGKFPFEQQLWGDGSSAGIFVPGTSFATTGSTILQLNQSRPFDASADPDLSVTKHYYPLPSMNQTITGLKPNMNYSLAYAFTAVTRIAAPGDWHWSTFNFSIAATGDGRQHSGGIRTTHNSTTIDLDIHQVSSFRTFVSMAGNNSSARGSFGAAGGLQVLTADSNGEISVLFEAAGKGVDLYLYYVSVYDPGNNICNFVKDKPTFVDGGLVPRHELYQVDNSTEAAWYCQPKSNVVQDPRFTTVGSDKALWAITSNVTDNFGAVEFSDGSPGGLYLPYVDGGGSGATIEQDILLSHPGAVYNIYASLLIKNSSLPYDMVIFRLRVRLSNTSDHATTFYDTTWDGMNYGAEGIGLIDIVTYPSRYVHLTVDVSSNYAVIIIPEITMYLNAEPGCGPASIGPRISCWI